MSNATTAAPASRNRSTSCALTVRDQGHWPILLRLPSSIIDDADRRVPCLARSGVLIEVKAKQREPLEQVGASHPGSDREEQDGTRAGDERRAPYREGLTKHLPQLDEGASV